MIKKNINIQLPNLGALIIIFANIQLLLFKILKYYD